MASISLPLTGPRQSIGPRLLVAVSGDSLLGGGELGVRTEHPGGDGGQGQLPLAAVMAVQQALEAEPAAGPEHGHDMAVGERALGRS